MILLNYIISAKTKASVLKKNGGILILIKADSFVKVKILEKKKERKSKRKKDKWKTKKIMKRKRTKKL